MVFERLDGSFCPVASMETSWGKLKIDILVGDKFLKELGGFVIKTMKLRVETVALEESKYFLVCSFDGLFFAVGYGLGMDGILS